MKFLIIGASGFVGRHVLALSKSSGYEALGTQAHSPRPGLLPFDLLTDRITDRVPPSFFETGQPVYAIICAVISQIDRCYRERSISHKVNVENTIRLIEDLRNHGTKIVFFSTSFVFDGNAGNYNEQDPPHPLSEYGRQKASVEHFIQSNPDGKLVLRLDKIVGDDPAENHLFSEWYRSMQGNQPITCIAGQVLSPTYVGDVASGVIVACQQGLSGLYHLAGPEIFPREELARQFTRAVGQQSPIHSKSQEEFGFLDKRPLKSYLDSTRFVKATGMRFTPMRTVFNEFRQKAGIAQAGVDSAAFPY